MRPYILVKGSSNKIEDFEEKISAALEEGYDFSSELICKTINLASGEQELMFIQPMTLEEEFEFDSDDIERLEEALGTN